MLAPTILFARQKYAEVAPHGNKQPPLAVTQPRCLEGKQDAQLAGEIEEVLKFALKLAGFVKIITGSSKENVNGIRPGEFDFAPWRTIGADFLLKTGYVPSLVAGRAFRDVHVKPRRERSNLSHACGRHITIKDIERQRRGFTVSVVSTSVRN